jgi:hypothetical protein
LKDKKIYKHYKRNLLREYLGLYTTVDEFVQDTGPHQWFKGAFAWAEADFPIKKEENGQEFNHIFWRTVNEAWHQIFEGKTGKTTTETAINFLDKLLKR